MHKSIDTIYHYPGYHGAPSFCRLRVFHDPDRPPVVLMSEVRDNPGTSVTNRAEVIAWDACKRFGLDPRNTLFFTHYGPGSFGDHRDPDRYARVVFQPDTRGGFMSPRFGPATPEWTADLIGHELAEPMPVAARVRRHPHHDTQPEQAP